MQNMLMFQVVGSHLFGTDGDLYLGAEYLGSEYLSPDPHDRDITATLRCFNLPTSIAPSDWPARETALRQIAPPPLAR